MKVTIAFPPPLSTSIPSLLCIQYNPIHRPLFTNYFKPRIFGPTFERPSYQRSNKKNPSPYAPHTMAQGAIKKKAKTTPSSSKRYVLPQFHRLPQYLPPWFPSHPHSLLSSSSLYLVKPQPYSHRKTLAALHLTNSLKKNRQQTDWHPRTETPSSHQSAAQKLSHRRRKTWLIRKNWQRCAFTVPFCLIEDVYDYTMIIVVFSYSRLCYICTFTRLRAYL